MKSAPLDPLNKMPVPVGVSDGYIGLSYSYPDSVRRALTIGISYHATFPEDWQLHHAHQDVDKIQNMLIEKYGYEKEDITVLRDSDDPNTHAQPTRENILQAMRDLVKDAKPGDRFVFHYSGHGSQVDDVDGDEDDGKDEVIWPSDIQIDDPNDPKSVQKNYILDDEIKEILIDHLPLGAHLTIVFDSCHSGTAADLPQHHSDHLQDSPPSPLNTRGHPKILPVVVESTPQHLSGVEEYGTYDEDDIMSPITPHSPTGSEDSFNNTDFAVVVSWSACKDAQLTYECPKGGIFVALLSHILEQTPDISHGALLHELSSRFKKCYTSFSRPKDGDCAGMVSLPRPQLSTLDNYWALLDKPVCF